jgi:GNAT superfamily N-acetyltransferase
MHMEINNYPLSSIRQQLILRRASFGEVYPIWRDYLWPNRVSAIKEVSPIKLDLTFDPSICEQEAYFFVFEFQGKIIGTISGYKTDEMNFRIRGLYVVPEFRNLGLSQALFTRISETAEQSGASFLWSLPRKSAWKSYKTFGFYQVSDWFEDGMEFGPNCIAKLALYTKDQIDTKK